MKVFPHILARIGGESFEMIAQMKFPELVATTEAMSQREAQREKDKESLCSKLLVFIQTLNNSKTQNVLQNLRRDVFNGRRVKQADHDASALLLPGDILRQLDEYLDTSNRRVAEMERFRQLYTSELTRARAMLQTLSANESLRKGLLLSSRSLFESLEKFSQANPADFKKKEIQNEQALLKYLTRMVTKTSPFSTFNNLSIAGTATTEQPIHVVPGASATKVSSHLSLNNGLFKYLTAIFVSSRDIYRHLEVRLNPTVQVKDDHYLFLTNSDNVEAFQRIMFNPVVSLVYEKFLDGSLFTFKSLTESVLDDVDADADQIENYIRHIINYGFLEFNIGVSGIDPAWDIKLIEKLKPLEAAGVPLIENLIATLARLRAIALESQYADASDREALMMDAFRTIRKTCMELHEAAGLPADERKTPEQLAAEYAERRKVKVAVPVDNEGVVELKAPVEDEPVDKPAEGPTFVHRSFTYFGFKPEHLFYEDTSRDVKVEFDDGQLNELINSFDSLIGEMRVSNALLEEREYMAYFVKKKWGEHKPVDLLSVYEEYFRESKRIEEELKTVPLDPNSDEAIAKKPEITRTRYANIARWKEAYDKVVDSFVSKNMDQINLHREGMHDVNRSLGIGSNHTDVPNSYGAFLQFFSETDENGTPKLKAVLNGNFAGHGKLLSRFLHIFPNQVTNDVRSWNSQFETNDSIFAEDCDASYFNANLHPPLLPYEVRIPGGHNSLPADQQLPISELEVKVENDDAILIHRKTGKRVFVLDLGFQGQNGRSYLFRLLTKFSTADLLFPGLPLQSTNRCWNKLQGYSPSEMKINICPRVLFEDRIVLQRKAWFVPKVMLPIRKPNQDDASYYSDMQQWRRSNGIDREVFVFLHPDKNNTGVESKLLQKIGKDDYKPQYIDFSNPLFIRLFEKLMDKVPVVMKLEEMLPSPSQMIDIDGKKFVSEFMVQWYNYKKS